MLRSTYAEWYRPSEAELKAIFKEGTIALDTNVLFALYRMGTTTREKILDALLDDAVRSRIFVPYQVGLEYTRNRLSVAKEPHAAFTTTVGKVEALKKLLSKGNGLNIRDVDVQKEIEVAAVPLLDQLSAEIRRIEAAHTIAYSDVEKDDPILNSLENILRDQGQIGTAPKPAVLQSLIKTAHERYDQKIPPGYADKVGAKAKEQPEGDYLIWQELLDKAAGGITSLLFVTEDQTEDWYLQDSHGNAVGPRPELRAEMPVAYHQTTLTNFLKFINPILTTQLGDETLKEVERAVVPPKPTNRVSRLQPRKLTRQQRLFRDALGDAVARNSLRSQLDWEPVRFDPDFAAKIREQATIPPEFLEQIRKNLSLNELLGGIVDDDSDDTNEDDASDD